ncbi:hypothetical protein VA602_12950, partial [Pseudomonas sp. MH2]
RRIETGNLCLGQPLRGTPAAALGHWNQQLEFFEIFFDPGLYSPQGHPYSAHHNDGQPTL